MSAAVPALGFGIAAVVISRAEQTHAFFTKQAFKPTAIPFILQGIFLPWIIQRGNSAPSSNFTRPTLVGSGDSVEQDAGSSFFRDLGRQ